MRLQSKLAAFEDRADAGNDMVLALDPGKQVGFEAVQVFDSGGAFMNCSRVWTRRTSATAGRHSRAACG